MLVLDNATGVSASQGSGFVQYHREMQSSWPNPCREAESKEQDSLVLCISQIPNVWTQGEEASVSSHWSRAQEENKTVSQEGMEKETATHSSILAWRVPWTEEPGRLQSTVSQELDMTE